MKATAATTEASRPLSILVAALGGEGGGVLARWLVQCARASGLAVQATSVPGVAQRTGATSYYIELLRAPLGSAPSPVFSLHPTAATVDVVLASELVEAARVMERGFVSPQTVLVTSTHRVYTTAEKLVPDDGRYDSQRALAALRALAQRCVAFDMERIANEHRTVISAVMFGALAGSGTLPWSRELCERVIADSGRGAQASLAGFAAAFAQAQAQASESAKEPARQTTLEPSTAVSGEARATEAMPAAIRQRMAAWPPSVRAVAMHGVRRCTDYQDAAYAALYVEHIDALVAAQPSALPALEEAARTLALWMCFEDVIRVADLKSRRSRFEQLRAEVAARPGDVVHVTEHFKPGVNEVSAVMPRALGAALQRLVQRRPALARWQVSLHIRSTSVWGFLLLRAMASLRPLRPRSLRFGEEHEAIRQWVAALVKLLPRSPDFARVLAELPSVRKGYGDTQSRGHAHHARLWRAHVEPALAADSDALAAAALPFKDALRAALHQTPDEPLPPLAAAAEQPIRFHARRPSSRVP